MIEPTRVRSTADVSPLKLLVSEWCDEAESARTDDDGFATDAAREAAVAPSASG